jgi:hypothetical protein
MSATVTRSLENQKMQAGIPFWLLFVYLTSYYSGLINTISLHIHLTTYSRLK